MLFESLLNKTYISTTNKIHVNGLDENFIQVCLKFPKEKYSKLQFIKCLKVTKVLWDVLSNSPTSQA